MRETTTRRGTSSTIIWTLLFLGWAAAPASATETTPSEASGSAAQSSTDASRSDSTESKSTSENGETPDIASADKTGLQLGSESVSADQALAHLDRTRKARDGGDDDASSGDDTQDEESESPSEASSLSTSTSTSHPCEPYPSCARADLGSKEAVDSADFLKVARAHNDEIRSCFEQAAEGTPEGRLVLRFEIAEGGQAEKVAVESTSVELDGFGECAAEKVGGWEFPNPSEFGYDSLKVSHPYTFGAP